MADWGSTGLYFSNSAVSLISPSLTFSLRCQALEPDLVTITTCRRELTRPRRACSPQSCRHGLLTYALAEEGLRQHKADFAPQNGEITVDELIEYATNRVLELQNEGANCGFTNEVDPIKQHPRSLYRRQVGQEPVLIGAH